MTAGGGLAREKIARNPTNRESWWWPTTRSGPRRPGPYRSASRRDRQFCSAALWISSFSIMKFLVSPTTGASFDRTIDRDPKRPREVSRRDARGEKVRRSIKAVPWNRRCPCECSLLLSNLAPIVKLFSRCYSVRIIRERKKHFERSVNQ